MASRINTVGYLIYFAIRYYMIKFINFAQKK